MNTESSFQEKIENKNLLSIVSAKPELRGLRISNKKESESFRIITLTI